VNGWLPIGRPTSHWRVNGGSSPRAGTARTLSGSGTVGGAASLNSIAAPEPRERTERERDQPVALLHPRTDGGE
jgi:hypothetical protein